MLFFTINLLTSILERRLGLLFEFQNFLGRDSEVVEVSEDLAFREFLKAFLDVLVCWEDIFSRLGWCLRWWTDISSLEMYQ